ncbi:MAG TPA: hypothetical protein VHZ24_07425 [Pirellulales bacterium]|jgi:hypothetical protein|nr:hypothetical protein [Pirellulales bacterium]
MSKPEQLWRQLAAAAHAFDTPPTPPPGFADRVVECAFRRPVASFVLHERQRIVSTAAWVALAASVLICFWSWRELEAAWWTPPIFDSVVHIEPLP